MKTIFGWFAAALLAGALSLGAQTQGQTGPRGVDKDGDGKCDVCGRPAAQIGQRRGPGAGQGRGMRGRGMRCQNCQNCQCPGCQGARQNQNQQPQQPPPQQNN